MYAQDCFQNSWEAYIFIVLQGEHSPQQSKKCVFFSNYCRERMHKKIHKLRIMRTFVKNRIWENSLSESKKYVFFKLLQRENAWKNITRFIHCALLSNSVFIYLVFSWKCVLFFWHRGSAYSWILNSETGGECHLCVPLWKPSPSQPNTLMEMWFFDR